MLVSEFEKRIKNIDSHLFLEKGYGFPNAFDVYYSKIDEDKFVLSVGENGKLNTFNGELKFINNKSKRKLLLASVDMAMTPLHKRVEHKWNVIVGNDNCKGLPLVIWVKVDYGNHDYILGGAEKNDLKDSETRFSDSEYAKLIEYIKTLPDGDWQAKVAEHGKTEVKSEDGED